MFRMFVLPLPNSHAEIRMLDVMVLGGGAFGRCLGHEGTALMNEISVFLKETPQSSLTSCTMWGNSKKVPSMNQEAGSHRTPNLPAPWTSTSQAPELWQINL